MTYKKICFMYRHKDYAVDGIRSALGLAVENMYVCGVVLDNSLDLFDDNLKESIEMLRYMEGDVFSTVPANGSLTEITLTELGEKLREMTHIIPYGIK